MHLNAACDSITSPFPDYPVNTVLSWNNGPVQVNYCCNVCGSQSILWIYHSKWTCHGNYVYLAIETKQPRE